MHRQVLIVGGGIAGVQAALDLAEAGVEVYLVEKGPSIGGRMAQLDKTFPTNDCAMCILSPKLVEAGGHPNINIISNAELESLSGQKGDFKVKVIIWPRYVDEAKCTGCGICMTKCPVKIPDEYNKGLSKTKNIRIPFPQAVPAIPIMDKATCLYHQRGTCRICEKSCEQKAIDFQQKEQIIDLEVGAIILATGSGEFDARLKGEYGYKAFSNVITSIELERILSASGPTRGHVRRPSDDKEPKRIAFVQCVGSRDMQIGNQYCSAICCMQAAKDATILAEHIKGVETTIFYMDIRAYGKDFDKFIDRVQSQYGARFLRARISAIDVDSATDDLKVRYDLAPGRLREETFDLVVLSIGLESKDGTIELANRLGIELDLNNFFKTDPFFPVATSRRGVLVCGTLSGPKDIPETVMEASGAASAASCLLTSLPAKEIKQEFPQEVDITGQPTRIGVFVCRCGINIAATVDVPKVVECASGLPGVAHSQELLFACSQDSQKLIAQTIREKNLNRVIVSACTPRTHEPLFQKTLQLSGLNPYLFEFANIREQCSWVHQKEPEKATQKAKDLVKMSVAKARLLDPLSRMSLGMKKQALVIGGGAAGMTAALDLSAQGFEVYLLEKEAQLGGNLRDTHHTLSGQETLSFLNSLIKKIESEPKIKLYTNATIKEISGYVGNFKTTIKTKIPNPNTTKSQINPKSQIQKDEVKNDQEIEIEHGVIIVATGAKEYLADKFLYKQDPRVLTQKELERLTHERNERLLNSKSIVMIQCVGSRDEARPYCSRICCSQAIKNALKLKGLNPELNIYILYRDIRTYGTRELYYKQAREEGIIFIQYEPEEEPVVEKVREVLNVKVKDPILNKALSLKADFLILSMAIVPPEENKQLSQMLKVPLNADGFFLEAHVKLRPVDFATDGIFVCGLAHYPKDLSESIAQAKAAASRAATLLSKTQIEAEGKVAWVKKERCVGCGVCVEVCPYNAIELDKIEKVAVVNGALCKGCGACAASCLPAAIDLKGFKDEHILAALSVA